MRIVAMVPIKLSSERVKNKNIRQFYDGKPLVKFILEALQSSKYVDDIYVYCSSEKIKDYLTDGVRFLKRPKYLDGNDCNCNDIIGEFIKVIDASYYVVCHATAPFTRTDSIDRCIESVIDLKEYDSSFTVERIQSFLWNGIQPLNFNVDHFPRTQDLDPIYKETSGVFVFPKWVFEKYKRRVGKKPCLVEVDQIEGIDIDSEYDMSIAQMVYKQLKKNK